ncbi:hypothetical protein LTR51_008664 [Lithohypha guttulata]|nr:hypothetical protein LTR51_008664 [Lithohypha guttulata]
MTKSPLNRLDYLMCYSRRHFRWIIIVSISFIVVYLCDTPFPSTSASFSRVTITKSSYDWSVWQPRYPVESIEPLPTAIVKKLAQIQHAPTRHPRFGIGVQEKRREEVRQTMLKGWKSYKERAWMRDELMPLTGSGQDTFGGWAATMVDAMDTLWIMGLKKEFGEAVRAVVTLDWAQVQGTACNMFETTIRHLGGLLSAYDLSREPALLAKAVELGDMLYAGFDTPNHMPPFWFDFEKAKTGNLVPDDHQPAASAATLSLEFTRLAQLTGQDKYYDVVARVAERLYENQNLTKLPGMWPAFFDLKNGVFNHDNTFTLGALSDSMYEYVLKMHILLGATEPKYEQLYRATADTIIKNLLFRPMTPNNLDILFAGTYRVGKDVPLEPEGQHLACFAGGMFAMGGKIFGIPEHVSIGARLTEGCMWAYNAFSTGLAPEIFKLIPCKSLSGCIWDEQKWLNAVNTDADGHGRLPKGFQNARDPRYILRPEALESVFILYRITGQEEYRDAAWKMFRSIQAATSTLYGNAAIEDVTVTGTPQQRGSMESFWMAETLKYLYLTFSPADMISLDDYVFNTECHPFRIPKS